MRGRRYCKKYKFFNLGKKATGKRKRNEPKVNYCHKIMPDGTNKSIFSDLDKEECKEKKRTTGSKRKCTCKCLPGWKKGKETDADGNKITLCNQVTLFFVKISVIFEIFGNFDDIRQKLFEDDFGLFR